MFTHAEKSQWHRAIVLAISGILGLCVSFYGTYAEETKSKEVTESKPMLKDDFNGVDSEVWEISRPKDVTTKEGVLSLNTSGADIRITSWDIFLYGTIEAKIRYSKPASDNRFYYIGFMERKNWGHNACQVMIQGSKAFFQAKKDGGEVLNVPILDLEPFTWYTVKIVCSPNRLEVFVDGKSYAFTEDVKYIPQNRLPVIIDVFFQGAGEISFDVDWIKVNKMETTE